MRLLISIGALGLILLLSGCAHSGGDSAGSKRDSDGRDGVIEEDPILRTLEEPRRAAPGKDDDGVAEPEGDAETRRPAIEGAEREDDLLGETRDGEPRDAGSIVLPGRKGEPDTSPIREDPILDAAEEECEGEDCPDPKDKKKKKKKKKDG